MQFLGIGKKQNVYEIDLEWKPKWIITLESGKEAQSVWKIEMNNQSELWNWNFGIWKPKIIQNLDKRE